MPAVTEYMTVSGDRIDANVPVEDGPRLLGLVRAEYAEMPGLSLDVRQAARLWNVRLDASEWLLQRLCDDGFLAMTDRGRYVRS